MATMDQRTAAKLLGVTDRRLRQLEQEDDPPPRNADGSYPSAAFIRWMTLRRTLKERGPRAVALYELALVDGEGAGLHRVRDELLEIIGVPDDPPPPACGYTFGRRIADDRRGYVDAMRARAAAARSAKALRAIVAEYLDAQVFSEDGESPGWRERQAGAAR